MFKNERKEKMNMKKKIMFVFTIMMSILCISVVNAERNITDSELESYGRGKSIIGGYLYSDYLNDNAGEQYYDHKNDVYLIMQNYDNELNMAYINKMINENENVLLIELPENVTSVKSYDIMYCYSNCTIEDIEKNSQSENVEIVKYNNTKYALVKFKMELDYYSKYDGKYTRILLYTHKIIITETEENKKLMNYNFYLDAKTEEYREVPVSIVDENGMAFFTIVFDNTWVEGLGLSSIPTNIDLSKMYIEYKMPEYVGEVLKTKYMGDVPYIMTDGIYSIYRTSLDNSNCENKGIIKADIDYKGLNFIDDLYFSFDDEYYDYYELPQASDQKVEIGSITVEGKMYGELFIEQIWPEDSNQQKIEKEIEKIKGVIVEEVEQFNLTFKEGYVIEEDEEWGTYSYYDKGFNESPLKMTIDYDDSYNGKKFTIIQMIKNKLEFEHIEGIIENGKLSVELAGPSPIAVVIYDDEIDDSENNKKDEVIDTDKENNKPTDSDNKDEVTNTDNKVEDSKPVVDNTTNKVENEVVKNPETGDNINFNLIISILSISLLVLVICTIKKSKLN